MKYVFNPFSGQFDLVESVSHVQGTDVALGAVAAKNPPVDADKTMYRDSTASDALVTSTWTQVKAFLKTYFDTLYNKYVHPDHSGEVTSVADGAQTITGKAVTLAKLDDMATASFRGRNTAGVGVPEILSKATALSILNVADGADVTSVNETSHADVVVDGDIGVNVQAYDVDIALFRRHTLEAGDFLTVGEDEQKLVHDTFAINGTGSLTIDGSGELCTIGA